MATVTKGHVEAAVRRCQASGDVRAFNRDRGRKGASAYPVRWDGADYSAAVIYEEACRIACEEAGEAVRIPAWQGGVRSPIGVGRRLVELGIPVFDKKNGRFVDLSHPDYAVERVRPANEREVPEPTDLAPDPEADREAEGIMSTLSPDEIRHRLRELGPAPTFTTEVERRVRSALVVAQVLLRANGRCEVCEEPAPFQKPSGIPYLEVHHIEALAEGGADDPGNCGAVCPNCHREIHFGERGRALNGQLAINVSMVDL